MPKNISERQGKEILKQNLPKLFKRQGKMKGYKRIREFKKDAKFHTAEKKKNPSPTRSRGSGKRQTTKRRAHKKN